MLGFTVNPFTPTYGLRVAIDFPGGNHFAKTATVNHPRQLPIQDLLHLYHTDRAYLLPLYYPVYLQ